MTERELRWLLSGGWNPVFALGVVTLCGLFLAGLVASGMYTDHEFQTQGVRADGVVLSKDQVKTTNKGRATYRYYVGYAFTDAAGVRREGTSQVSDLTFVRVSRDSPHPVEYLPDSPDEHRLLSPHTGSDRKAMGMGAVALVGFAGLFGFFVRRAAVRKAHLVFHGTARSGRVVVSEVRRAGTRQASVMRYHYKDLEGRQQTSKEVTIPTGMASRWRPGSPITVLIDPRAPTRHEPDLWCVRGVPGED